jgi:peptidoglycan/LPS O-acetylase OafA/YrhL
VLCGHAGSALDDPTSWRSSRTLAAATVAGAAAAAAAAATAAGGAAATAGVAAAVAGAAAAVLVSGALSGKGGVSPSWESIDATRHLLLMLCQPFHTVACYEVRL